MSYRQLRDEIIVPGLDCCRPQYLCSNLAKELSRARKALGYGEAAEKKLEETTPSRKKGVPADLRLRRSTFA